MKKALSLFTASLVLSVLFVVFILIPLLESSKPDRPAQFGYTDIVFIDTGFYEGEIGMVIDRDSRTGVHWYTLILGATEIKVDLPEQFLKPFEMPENLQHEPR